MVSVLEKIASKKDAKDKAAVNLGARKSAAPAGGFSAADEPDAKKQKTEEPAKASGFGGDWKNFDYGEKGDEMQECINCGS